MSNTTSTSTSALIDIGSFRSACTHVLSRLLMWLALEAYAGVAFLYWLGTGACRKEATTSGILLTASEVAFAQTASNIGLPYILDSFLKLHIVLIFHMDSGRFSMCCNTSSRSCRPSAHACHHTPTNQKKSDKRKLVNAQQMRIMYQGMPCNQSGCLVK